MWTNGATALPVSGIINAKLFDDTATLSWMRFLACGARSQSTVFARWMRRKLLKIVGTTARLSLRQASERPQLLSHG
jgi:hypothetical protein